MQNVLEGVSNIENVKSRFSSVKVTGTAPAPWEGWDRDGDHGTGKCQAKARGAGVSEEPQTSVHGIR